ncbi:hypothetical protein SAMN05443144_101382 [Fodinibius roseus]|uniref:Uncharacterized protein n=1 Tax=Fodinibius roseus TaxID=1194090 RepID=A0A1M4TTK5_9BACT|nr:hypothetical protein SAMN05443144_101382 [Fodinibius roseus]
MAYRYYFKLFYPSPLISANNQLFYNTIAVAVSAVQLPVNGIQYERNKIDEFKIRKEAF